MVTSGINVLTIILPLGILLVAIVSQLGSTGRLGRNSLLGIRSPSTMTSDEAWRAGHRAATIPAWSGFTAMGIIALISWVLVDSPAATGICTMIIGALFIVTGTWSIIAASRAARAVASH